MPRPSQPLLHLSPLEDRVVPTLAGVPANAVVVAPDTGGIPVVRVVSPSTGATVGEVQAYEDSFRGGVRAALGDVTGDGVRDLVIAPGVGGGPRARIIDGKTGATVADFFVYEPTYTGGVYVAVADVNGDGRADLITGTGVGGGPRVRVLDGASLGATTLKDYFAYEDSFRGGVQVAAGDVTGDGIAEVIAGTGVGGGPVVKTFGADGRVLTTVVADDPGFRGGVRVDATDADGDGRAEVVTRVRRGNAEVLRLFAGTAGTLTDVIVRPVDDNPSPGDTGGGVVVPGVVTSLEGTVTAVNAAAGTVAVSVAGGPAQTVRTGPGTIIERNDATAALNTFQAGDRVQVRVGADGLAVKLDAHAPTAPSQPVDPGTPSGPAPTGDLPGPSARIEGTITAVDAAGGAFSIRSAKGTVYLIRVTAATKIEKNGVTVPLSAFLIGDFGQARTDAAGVVTRAEAVPS
ncbi:MAG: VCBS repeat-containing protein [Gemmataceae bacterium]